MNHRGIFDRFFSLCFGFFIACVLIYIGVQLVKAVLGWLIIGGLILGIGVLLSSLLRWRRERW